MGIAMAVRTGLIEMTYSPKTLLDLRAYLQPITGLAPVALGIQHFSPRGGGGARRGALSRSGSSNSASRALRTFRTSARSSTPRTFGGHPGKPPMCYRGQSCYVDATLPGHRRSTPNPRLRYQGTCERWTIGIWSPAASGTPSRPTQKRRARHRHPRTGH
jgi:hypothetical protein